LEDLDHQSADIEKMLEESPLPLVDKADTREEPVKRSRGRPKLEGGQKGNYNISTRERARRQTQTTIRNAKKARDKAQWDIDDELLEQEDMKQ